MDHVIVYSQSSGLMYLEDDDRNRIALARGYSGHGTSINDPDSEGFVGRGPIPRGVWKVGSPIDSRTMGKHCIPLSPIGHDAHHRSGFYIHGDNNRGDRSASTGCIIMTSIRRAVMARRICGGMIIHPVEAERRPVRYSLTSSDGGGTA